MRAMLQFLLSGVFIVVSNCLVNIDPIKRFVSFLFSGKLMRSYAVTNLLIAVTVSVAFGQHVPGTNDASFNTTDVVNGAGRGADGTVYTVVVQSNGKLVVGGEFHSYNGMNRKMIARLHADGTLDDSFNPGSGFTGRVTSIALQEDGKMVVGGQFSSYNGVNKNRIVRLNVDGTLDDSFNPGTGFNGFVNSIVLQSDGKIVVGGSFTSFNGTSRIALARLNTDGSLDTSFNSENGFSGNNYCSVMAISLQSNGKATVGGQFTSFKGASRNNIVRLNPDGTLDTSFGPGTGFNSYVGVFALQSDGKMIVGGDFSSYNGASRNRIARLNTDGSLDDSFSPGTGFTGAVRAINLQDDGKLVVGGSFIFYQGKSHNRIIRLNPDGSPDESFSSGTGFSWDVDALALQSDGKVLVGGGFNFYNNIILNKITRLNTMAVPDDSFNPITGFNYQVRAVVCQNDGKVVVGGNFTWYNNTAQNHIVRLNADGSIDNTFHIGTGFNSNVEAIAVQDDGKLLVGGYFTSYNGIVRNRIARLNSDGTLDTSFNPGGGFSSYVSTIVLQSDGKVIVGGNFHSYNGILSKSIAFLNADGSVNASYNLGTGFTGNVHTIALQNDGKTVVGGDFVSYNGTTRNSIARLNTDGSLDASFNPGIGFNSGVQSIALQSEGKIIVGGDFISYNGTTRNSIARLNTDGSLDASFNSGTGFSPDGVNAIALQSDGKVVVGGHFTAYNGTARNRIARLHADGSLDNSFQTGNGFSDVVYSIALQSDGKVVAGGWFSAYDNIPRNRIARLHGGGGTSLSAEKDLQEDPQLLLYPNPTQGDINLEFSGTTTMVGASELKLYNALGRQVLSREVSAAEAQAGVKLATTGLASGVYFLSISNWSGIVTKRVVLGE